MLKKIGAWLRNVPVAGLIDQRNVAFFQSFLIYFGIFVYVAQREKYLSAEERRRLSEHFYNNVLPWPSVAMVIDYATDLAMCLACFALVFVVRKGHLKLAVRLYLVFLLGLLTINYATVGNSFGTPYASLALIISALMLGRRALWWVYAANVFNYSVGVMAVAIGHAYRGQPFHPDLLGVVTVAVNQFMVAIVLDQTVKALRGALSETVAQREQLRLQAIEREQTQQQVIHLEKMKVVGQLASGTAHDFNNVLGIILGFARERRRPKVGAPETVRETTFFEALEGVELAARRGAAITRKLLDFSRGDSGARERFDVVDALRELQPMLQQLLPDNVHLSLSVPEQPVFIEFERTQFELALLNLTANARDAMPDGGDCAIALSRTVDSTVMLSIRDTGGGMTEQTQQRIFEPFFTTKPSGLGTGLGLSVVYGLITHSGGRITVESALEQGTTFVLHLPEAHAMPAVALPGKRDSRLRVLLVDDDDVLRDLLEAALEDNGFIVEAAGNGAAALQRVKTMPSPPDVLVCDHHMPDMDGASLLRQLRQWLPRTPAVLISANHSQGESAAPDDAYTSRLPKPFSPERLVGQVRQVTREGDDAGQLDAHT
jgi:signal transduction histidine kinase